MRREKTDAVRAVMRTTNVEGFRKRKTKKEMIKRHAGVRVRDVEDLDKWKSREQG